MITRTCAHPGCAASGRIRIEDGHYLYLPRETPGRVWIDDNQYVCIHHVIEHLGEKHDGRRQAETELAAFRERGGRLS